MFWIAISLTPSGRRNRSCTLYDDNMYNRVPTERHSFFKYAREHAIMST